MTTRDLHSNIKTVQLFAPVVVTTDQNSSGLDTKGFDSAELVVLVGVTGDTLSGSVKIDLVLQDSDDDSDYADVTEASYVLVGSDSDVSAPDANGIFRTIDDAAEDATQYRIGYRGPKRYVRAQIDVTGTHTNGTEFAVLGILGHAHERPTAD